MVLTRNNTAFVMKIYTHAFKVCIVNIFDDLIRNNDKFYRIVYVKCRKVFHCTGCFFHLETGSTLSPDFILVKSSQEIELNPFPNKKTPCVVREDVNIFEEFEVKYCTGSVHARISEDSALV